MNNVVELVVYGETLRVDADDPMLDIVNVFTEGAPLSKFDTLYKDVIER